MKQNKIVKFFLTNYVNFCNNNTIKKCNIKDFFIVNRYIKYVELIEKIIFQVLIKQVRKIKKTKQTI